VIKIRLF